MTREPAFNGKVRLGPARALTGDLWGLLGSCPTAGACVDWLRRVTSPDGKPMEFGSLEKAAAAVEPSAGNPVFIPARGGDGGHVQLVGLGMHHKFGHVARAVLEGAAMSARELLLRMQAAGASPSMLRAVGGATRSRFWMQILSDVTGLPLEVAGVQEAAAFGAAMLAGKSTGVIAADVDWPQPSLRVEPRPELHAVYDELFRKFTEGSA